jgi:hypothetical protein
MLGQVRRLQLLSSQDRFPLPSVSSSKRTPIATELFVDSRLHSTAYVTKTVTTAIPTKTITSTIVATSVKAATSTSTSKFTSLFTNTETTTTDLTDTVTATTTPVTTTVTSTTVTVTVTASPPAKKRSESLPLRVRQDLPHAMVSAGMAIAVRAPSSYKATTISATKVPTYASACYGASRYSSACSCNGIKPTAVTLRQSTVTSTATKTLTNKPSTTVTRTSVVLQTATTVVGATQEVDVTTTVSATELRTVTLTTTVTEDPSVVTETDTAIATATLSYQSLGGFIMTDSNARSLLADPGRGRALVEKTNIWSIVSTDSSGALTYTVSSPYYAKVALTGHDTINLQGTADDQPTPEQRVYCMVPGVSNPAQPSGPLHCTANRGTQTYLQVCDEVVYLSTGPVAGCSPITISVEPL